MSPAVDVSDNLKRTFPPPSAADISQSTEGIETITRVPTFAKKTPKTFDLTTLDSSQLAQLKINDPFFYYSIPAMKDAFLHGTDADLVTLVETATAEASASGKTMVARKSRVTTEGHLNLLLEEMFGLSAYGMTTMSDENDYERDADSYRNDLV